MQKRYFTDSECEWSTVIPSTSHSTERMQMNEAFKCHNTEHLRYWHPPYSTAAFVGNADATFRTMDDFDSGAVKSSSMSDRFISSPTEHRHHCISPSSANADACATSSDAHLWWNLDDAENYACNDRSMPVRSRPADCYQYGPTGIQSYDRLHHVSVDNLRTAKSEYPAAGNVTSCSYGDKTSPVLHSVHCSSSCQAENSVGECCDMNGVRTTKPHYHSHTRHQQPVFTNCRKTDFGLYSMNHEQYRSAPHVRQSTSMNELDDIDLPLHDASSVSSSMLDEMVRNNISGATDFSFSSDFGCDASSKRDSVSSRLPREEQGKLSVDDPEFSWHANASKKTEKRDELNVQNCFEADASTRSPSICSKLPFSARKSKKKVQRPSDEKSRPAVAQKIVGADCQNLPAYNGAVESNLCNAASEHVPRTDLSAELDTNVQAAANGNVRNSLQEENSKSKGVDTADYLSSEHKEASSTDSVQADKPSRVSGSRLRVESRVRAETTSGVHQHRRSLRRTSRAGSKQKSARHGDSEQYCATTNFHLKHYLESVDWQQLHQSIGVFFILFFFKCL